ncbi:MAG: hypothetical protein ACR2KX_19470 [Chitinophagaceae bacterium]
MITLEKLLTELKAESLNEIVAGNGSGKNGKGGNGSRSLRSRSMSRSGRH